MTKYLTAGVDISQGDELVKRIIPLAHRTRNEGTIGQIGGFASLYDHTIIQAIAKIKNPILVSGTDGVGTKLKFAIRAQRHDTIGIDLVAMCVNDIITTGARPLFFLDYFASGKTIVDTAAAVISGIAEGCVQAGCALIGGENAEMPGIYHRDDYDLAGFAVGIVDRDDVVDGSAIAEGDAIIGIAASGLHSNGYSFINHFLEGLPKELCHELLQELLNGKRVLDHLLVPTVIYAGLVQHLLLVARSLNHSILGMAHITGGGMVGNIPRIIPSHLTAVIKFGSWDIPPIYDWINEQTRSQTDEFLTVFNLGIGYVLVVNQAIKSVILTSINATGNKAWEIGYVQNREQGQTGIVML